MSPDMKLLTLSNSVSVRARFTLDPVLHEHLTFRMWKLNVKTAKSEVHLPEEYL